MVFCHRIKLNAVETSVAQQQTPYTINHKYCASKEPVKEPMNHQHQHHNRFAGCVWRVLKLNEYAKQGNEMTAMRQTVYSEEERHDV